MKAFRLALAFSLGMFIVVITTPPSLAMDFAFKKVTFPGGSDDVKPRLVLSGEITTGDTARLRHFIADNRIRMVYSPQVVLDSPGGSISEAMKMADLFNEMLFYVFVPPPGNCVSACFLLYVSAPFHAAWAGRVGIHRPYIATSVERDLSLSEAQRQQNAGLEKTKTWLQSHNVPQDLIDKMVSLPSTSAYWLNDEDLRRIGSRAPWFEEWVLAKCPGFLEVESAFLNDPYDQEKRNAFQSAAACEAGAVSSEHTSRLVTLIKSVEGESSAATH